MRRLMISGTALLMLGAPCAAQETPTEREAARDVVKQIQELDQSLAVPSMVAKLTPRKHTRSPRLQSRSSRPLLRIGAFESKRSTCDTN